MPRIAVNSFVELDESASAGVPAMASVIGAPVDPAPANDNGTIAALRTREERCVMMRCGALGSRLDRYGGRV
jgi:hypothetical protein